MLSNQDIYKLLSPFRHYPIPIRNMISKYVHDHLDKHNDQITSDDLKKIESKVIENYPRLGP